MPKIKYAGVKQGGETAFFHETGGITWYPGTVRNIADAALAARMLQHPDVFASAGNDAEDDGAPVLEVFGVADAVAPKVDEVETDAVVETPTGEADTSAISLAPGGTVAAAPAATPAPSPAPAPTAAPKAKAPAKTAAAKTKAKK